MAGPTFSESIYEHSPVILQHAMISAYGLKLKRVRYGGCYDRYLDELLRTQYSSAAELEELQNEELRVLVRHCYNDVPYYARLMRDRKLHPADIQTTADLSKLPILNKETVRAQPQLFHATTCARLPREWVGTSGTTGTTLRIPVELEGRRKNYAFFGRLKLWAGLHPSGRTATFAGRTVVPVAQKTPPFWRYNLAANTLLFSSYHLSDRNVPHYSSKLAQWSPQLIDSYPSAVSLVAQFVKERGGAAPRPKAIITSSETLTADQRHLITSAFGTPVFDQYGSAEQVCFISQCESGSYHVHPEYGVTEFIPVSSATTAQASRIVATGFTNWAMPLLRYDTGDLAVAKSGPCACGRQFPLIREIVGRVDDLLITQDGRRVGRLDPIFKGLETIRRAQIIQESLEVIRVLIVPGEGFLPSHRESLRHELHKRLGGNLRYVFEIVDDIPAGPGGKFRAVVSKVRGTTGPTQSLANAPT